ncbi:AAA family ATPase [Oerskovia rustica]|uniref:AAA family ATPase n=1 Tax=Oerskovia rustica TaxID=2762237 RepID=A0ABR8RTJ2_9CELL|nr:AAA family ATPase [Oerskovia rustica]MBD7950722.1 AAA family ATPase [Oerskovia rustica]
MRVAVVGAHGVGKSTLSRELGRRSGLEVPALDAMRDPVGSPPRSLLECTEAEVVQLSLRRYAQRVEQESATPDMISDGSVLHEWVYAAVRLRRQVLSGARQDGVLTDVVAGLLREAGARAARTYDLFLLLPVEFPLPPDDRPVSEPFRGDAEALTREVTAETGVPVHLLSGSIEDRLAAAASIVGRVRHETVNSP